MDEWMEQDLSCVSTQQCVGGEEKDDELQLLVGSSKKINICCANWDLRSPKAIVVWEGLGSTQGSVQKATGTSSCQGEMQLCVLSFLGPGLCHLSHVSALSKSSSQASLTPNHPQEVELVLDGSRKAFYMGNLDPALILL